MMTLKKILLIDATSSGITGLLLAFASDLVSNLTGITSTTAVASIGLFLIIFSISVLLQAQRKDRKPAIIKVFIMLDALWVVGSVLVCVSSSFSLTGAGYFLIMAIAFWVAVMGYLKFSLLNPL